MSTPPSATPTAPRRAGPGCLALAIALPVVIIIGIVVGTVLSRPDDPPEEVRRLLAEGTVEGVSWRVDAVRDVDGESCSFIYIEDAEVTGACTDAPQWASVGSQTVAFGRAPGDAEAVEVVLSDAETVPLATHAVDGVEGRFYAEVVDGDVSVERVRAG